MRIWPATLAWRIALLLLIAIAGLQCLNLYLLHKIRGEYISQTMTERANLVVARALHLESMNNEERQQAIENLSQYTEVTWSVGHVFLNNFPDCANCKSEIADNLQTALATRFAIKNVKPVPAIQVCLYDNKSDLSGKSPILKMLAKVDASRFPIAAIGIRFGKGEWFITLQSMQLELSGLFWQHSLYFTLFAGIFATLLLILLKHIFEPLQRLSKSAEAFGRMPESSDPFVESGPLETRRLARTLEQMRENAQEYIRQRNLLLMSLAHDIRTPLARIKLRVESLDLQEQRSALARDCRELELLAEQALTFAKSLASDEKPILLDMRSFVESMAMDYKDIGFMIIVEIPDKPIRIATRPACLRRCVINLLENALRYGNDVSIRLTSNETGVSLEICDSGPGVPETELENIMKPFHQCEPSRNKKLCGVGLGLSIAKNMAALAHAQLALHNVRGGFCARLDFS